MLQARKWCRYCQRKTPHTRAAMNDGLGCFLTVITLGLFLPVWIVIKVLEAVCYRWRCQSCGG